MFCKIIYSSPGNVQSNFSAFRSFFSFIFYLSGSICNLSEGLDRIGLSDIQLIVRLMCLAAAGRTDIPTGESSPVDNTRDMTFGQGVLGHGSSSLSYLSTAIFSLVSSNPISARMLMQLCTKVSFIFLKKRAHHSFHILSFILNHDQFITPASSSSS